MVLLILLFALTSASESSGSCEDLRTCLVGTRTGYAVHGPNNFNGEFIFDYSKVSNNKVRTNILHEVAAYNSSSTKEELITKHTSLTALVSTTRHMAEYVANILGFPEPDSTLVNLPINKIGSFYFGSPTVKDRKIPKAWHFTNKRGEVHRMSGSTTNSDITVADCGFPKSLYSLFEFGIHNAKTANETFYFVPAGGLPNAIVTNINGYGKRQWLSKWNPLEKCNESGSCTLEYNALYNWDSQTYGGDTGLTQVGIKAGILLSVHIQFALTPTPLKEPKEFKGPKCL